MIYFFSPEGIELRIFGKTSGLIINAEKSSIYFGGVGESLKQTILQDTQFSKGSFPFKYLGVPLSPHKPLASQFPPCISLNQQSRAGWGSIYLMTGGLN
jgi:hypothetical protein